MKPTLLCLHGWGGDRSSWDELCTALDGTDVTILRPDLPGFGAEPEPKQPWTTDDYAQWVEEWLTKQPIDHAAPLHLIGHSHGGRTSIKLATRGHLSIHHLYLCASAGIHRPRHLKRIIGLSLAKSGKFFLSIPGMRLLQPLGKRFLYKLVRVHDYEKASPIMRQTLINVTREDLRSTLEQIHIPTDIFWGTDDRMTPVADASVMHEGIKGSQLHLYAGVRHRVHRERATEIAQVIKNSL